MATSVWPSIRGTVSLDEFVSYCKKSVRYDDEKSIISASDMLAALANNRQLLIDAVNSALYRSIQGRGFDLAVSTHSLMLYADRNYRIRANIWKKPVVRAGMVEYDQLVYSYEFAHNHNFQLLTIGYLGPGYWTEIHECYPSEIVGYDGEKVRLRCLEKTSLPRGKVMLFRTLQDVHTQLPPDEFSVSLNLILTDPTGYVPSQYSFDIERSTIARLISVNMASRICSLSIAAVLGSPNNLDAALKLAKSDVPWRVRLAAFQCSASLARGQSKPIWIDASRDAHCKIREAATAELARC
jgi:hypothetical protein